MKIPIKDVLGVTMALLITGSTAFAMQPETVTDSVKATPIMQVGEIEAQATPSPKETKQETAPPPKEVTWQDNPQGCNQDTHFIDANAPFNCIAKPAQPVNHVEGGSTGSCEAEIAKYQWDVPVATAVAMAESGLRPWELNDNPSTGDYSVGCFQINIFGANALTRPSEAELKNAAVNVAWAWKIYVSNGHSFIGQWGVCRAKVACY